MEDMRMNPEQTIQNQFNILTSSDDALVPQIAISLTAMARNLSHAHIDFYLLHSRVSPENIQMLSVLCKGYGNIAFHEIRVGNPEGYDPLVQAGGWQRETYYPLCAHQLLPDTMERAMYLDAGDTLVVGDIAPYYTCDFEGNFLIVTVQRYKDENGLAAPLSAEDIANPAFLPGILKGLFNSGSYILNLEKMRRAELDLSWYCSFTENLRDLRDSFCPDSRAEKTVYFGDQGLLSAAFIGSLKYYGYPEIRDLWYCPYNFCIGYYDYNERKPDYQPAVLHFAGVPFKPWKAEYPIFPERFQSAGGERRELSELKQGQLEYYFLWLEYLFLTDKALSILGI